MNPKRVVTAWMPELLEKVVYRGQPRHHARAVFSPVASLRERAGMRDRLKCKPFRWYQENVLQVPLPDDPKYSDYQDSLRSANQKIPGFCANGSPNACNKDP